MVVQEIVATTQINYYSSLTDLVQSFGHTSCSTEHVNEKTSMIGYARPCFTKTPLTKSARCVSQNSRKVKVFGGGARNSLLWSGITAS